MLYFTLVVPQSRAPERLEFSLQLISLFRLFVGDFGKYRALIKSDTARATDADMQILVALDFPLSATVIHLAHLCISRNLFMIFSAKTNGLSWA